MLIALISIGCSSDTASNGTPSGCRACDLDDGQLASSGSVGGPVVEVAKYHADNHTKHDGDFNGTAVNRHPHDRILSKLTVTYRTRNA